MLHSGYKPFKILNGQSHGTIIIIIMTFRACWTERDRTATAFSAASNGLDKIPNGHIQQQCCALFFPVEGYTVASRLTESLAGN